MVVVAVMEGAVVAVATTTAMMATATIRMAAPATRDSMAMVMATMAPTTPCTTGGVLAGEAIILIVSRVEAAMEEEAVVSTMGGRFRR